MKKTILRNISLAVLVVSFFANHTYAQYGSQTDLIDSLKSVLVTSKGVEAIDLLNQLAFYTTLSSPDEAENIAKEAIKKAKVHNHPKGLATAYQRLGILSYRQGFSHQAIEYLSSADSIYHELGDSIALCINYRCLGNAYLGFQDYPTILQYYLRAQEYCDSIAEPMLYATNLHSIGSSLIQTDSMEKARRYIARASIVFYSQNYEFGIAGSISSLAEIDFKQGHYQLALDGYFEALPFYDKMQDKTTISSLQNKIAKVYLKLGQNNVARQFANASLKISSEIESKILMMEALKSIYLSYRQEGESNKALKYYEQYYVIFEEIFESRHQKTLKLLQGERRRSLAQSENILLKKNQELLEAKMDKQSIITLWAIIVITLATIFIIILAIINRQRKSAMALTEARRQELEDSNLTKNTLLDILSHDLKNPAGSIRGLSEILLEDSPENKYLIAIQKSSEKLIQLIEQTATFANLQQGNPIVKTDLNLKELINRAFEDNKVEINNYQMKIANSISDKMTIYANPIIESIFRNFIQNAVKYARSGKSISVDATQLDQGLKISVSDLGTSIPKKQREQIFRRSIQLDPLDNRGSGLGLAISKRIAEAHHAEIGVEARQPKGNSFYIIFPQKARNIS
ncbi:MAG: HAMP domain-containing sensor histidine kinase [Bacteroidota bacterium]|nr:HAMP domain-containing sensor histidine kinase [Bacteroidota bacterium]